MNACSMVNDQDFLVINGDTYFPIDLTKLYTFHTGQRSFITVALKRMKDFSRYGAVELDDSKIVQFHEKKFSRDGFIIGGIYAVNRKLLMLQHLPEAFSFENEILEKNAGTGDLKGMAFDEPFLDIGIPAEYRRAGNILGKRKISKR